MQKEIWFVNDSGQLAWAFGSQNGTRSQRAMGGGFDQFIHTFAEHYAFEHAINWLTRTVKVFPVADRHIKCNLGISRFDIELRSDIVANFKHCYR